MAKKKFVTIKKFNIKNPDMVESLVLKIEGKDSKRFFKFLLDLTDNDLQIINEIKIKEKKGKNKIIIQPLDMHENYTRQSLDKLKPSKVDKVKFMILLDHVPDIGSKETMKILKAMSKRFKFTVKIKKYKGEDFNE